MPEQLLQTPLYALNRRLGARMVDFAGWDMPVQYPPGIIAEHLAVRSGCGLFDLSHMGRVWVHGADAVALSRWCATRDFANVAAGQAAYALLCRDDGGILDDVIGYAVGPTEMLFVFNASNREKDVAFFREQAERKGFDATLDDQTLVTALIGVQGPNAQAVLQPLCAASLDAMPGYSFVQTTVLDQPALVARTGYTGEDGFEIMVAGADAESLWTALLTSGPGTESCGLGARDTLRTEAGMCLYGHEIDESTNPYEAKLGWVVDLDREPFMGQSALVAAKTGGSDADRRLVGLTVQPGGVPRPGCRVLHDGEPVGVLTSGTFSPSLKQNIGLGYLPARLARPGQAVDVEVRGKPARAEVTRLPFVPHRSRRRAARV